MGVCAVGGMVGRLVFYYRQCKGNAMQRGNSGEGEHLLESAGHLFPWSRISGCHLARDGQVRQMVGQVTANTVGSVAGHWVVSANGPAYLFS